MNKIKTKNKHTPGPWYFYTDSETKISGSDGKEIALMIQPYDSAQEDAAFIVRAVNAHKQLLGALIAAAQDIALTIYIDLQKGNDPKELDSHLVVYRKIIAKTEGK